MRSTLAVTTLTALVKRFLALAGTPEAEVVEEAGADTLRLPEAWAEVVALGGVEAEAVVEVEISPEDTRRSSLSTRVWWKWPTCRSNFP